MKALRLSTATYLPIFVALMIPTALPTQPVDASWTFGNAGSSSYRLDAFEPADMEFGALGGQDLTLPLELGKRYQVKVTHFIPHPFEVISKAPWCPH